MLVIQLTARHGDTICQVRQLLQYLTVIPDCRLAPILQEAVDIRFVVAGKGIGRIGIECLLQLAEQMLVIDDIAELLGLAIQPVDPAHCLEQPMILHRLIDEEIRAGRRIKPGQQFIDHDEQFHLRRFLHEFPLCLRLKRSDPSGNLALLLWQMLRIQPDHAEIGTIFQESIRLLILADRIRPQIPRLRRIR